MWFPKALRALPFAALLSLILWACHVTGEDQAFHDELRGETGACRPERATNRELALAGRCASEHETRNVGA